MSDLGSIPNLESGHGRPNFPGYDYSSNGGIPVVSKTDALVPGTQASGTVSMKDATPGENGR